MLQKKQIQKKTDEYDYTQTEERRVRQTFSPLGILRRDSEDSAG